MLMTGLLLLSSSLLNAKPSPVFANVSIGSAGPYRFLVDTGSQTTLIDPDLAARLHLQPEFRIEVVTHNSSQALPALKVKTLRIGQIALAEAEVVFHDVTEARRLDRSVEGVLGLNALDGFDWTLSARSGTLDLDAQRPSGVVIPFQRVENRIAIQARMGREQLTLILDSGATHVVLFRTPEEMVKTAAVPSTLATLDGVRSIVPTCWTADMFFGDGLRVGTLPAAIVPRSGAQADGLLPTSVFSIVYFDHVRSEVVLVH